MHCRKSTAPQLKRRGKLASNPPGSTKIIGGHEVKHRAQHTSTQAASNLPQQRRTLSATPSSKGPRLSWKGTGHRPQAREQNKGTKLAAELNTCMQPGKTCNSTASPRTTGLGSSKQSRKQQGRARENKAARGPQPCSRPKVKALQRAASDDTATANVRIVFLAASSCSGTRQTSEMAAWVAG
jgi:hypothetical protein